jgi:multidrug resistance efflux pump
MADGTFYGQANFEEATSPGIQVGAAAELILMSRNELLQGNVQRIRRGMTDRNAVVDAQLLANVAPTVNWVRSAQRIPVRSELQSLPQDVP